MEILKKLRYGGVKVQRSKGCTRIKVQVKVQWDFLRGF